MTTNQLGVGSPRSRVMALASSVAVIAGSLVMLVALVAPPGSWWDGYVSEAGTAGQPYAIPYRAGLVLLAAGVALLGQALRSLRTVSAALTAAAVLAATSGLVACTDRCPLPPYEPTTFADVVHAAASVLGMLVLAGAMALVWLADLRPAVRRLAGVAVVVTVPLGAILGMLMLFVGRSDFGAFVERAVLFVAVSWLIGTGGLLGVRRRALVH
ncbi:DUF998 domain-containing protein [Actinoplanes bogorensis]|uniref:DUF998 domain-containing protein n=1 Tax=Paractinoplanes bogorensis TaxID=1610840 RepID=A0ABS5Z3T1_9ACTN|nr:DUF998 domain-containing protein [Actinoplanes bogorensis]MBU2670346.1 DUF998 domain-containing protein [Actinoplanes bogorensis]